MKPLIKSASPPDYRIILPGFSGTILEELKLLPQGMSAQQALEKYRIDERARTLPLDEHFSKRLRAQSYIDTPAL